MSDKFTFLYILFAVLPKRLSSSQEYKKHTHTTFLIFHKRAYLLILSLLKAAGKGAELKRPVCCDRVSIIRLLHWFSATLHSRPHKESTADHWYSKRLNRQAAFIWHTSSQIMRLWKAGGREATLWPEERLPLSSVWKNNSMSLWQM